MRRVVAAVVKEHRRKRRPLAVWRDGKVVVEVPKAADLVHEEDNEYRTDARISLEENHVGRQGDPA